MTPLHYMATLPSSTWYLLCHGMEREEGDTPIYRTMFHGVVMCPSILFYIFRVLSIFILSYKYLFSREFYIMKHDNYYSYLLSTILDPSYFIMILSSCIAKLVSCDFYNLLECSKYALHISTVRNFQFYSISDLCQQSDHSSENSVVPLILLANSIDLLTNCLLLLVFDYLVIHKMCSC